MLRGELQISLQDEEYRLKPGDLTLPGRLPSGPGSFATGLSTFPAPRSCGAPDPDPAGGVAALPVMLPLAVGVEPAVVLPAPGQVLAADPAATELTTMPRPGSGDAASTAVSGAMRSPCGATDGALRRA